MQLRLDDIVAPLGVDAFFAEYVGRRPAHLTGAPQRLALPGWPELAELLNMSALWSAETLVMLLNGEPVAAERYCEPATDRDLQPTQRPVAERVLALQDAGALLVAREVETLSPALKRIAAALEAGFAARVSGELHVRRAPTATPTRSVAVTDVLIATIAGAIEVRVSAGAVAHPIPHPKFIGQGGAPEARETLLVARVAAGERVYLPRGSVYDLDSVVADAASIVFTITRPVGLDVLPAFAEIALDDAFFRSELPRGEAERRAWLAELGRRLGALATAPRAVAALAQIELGFRRDLRDYRLPADGPGAGARYRRNTSRLEVVETPHGWQLRAARGAVPIPAGRERLVAWIVARAEFSDDELGAAFPDAGADLVATLLRELAAMKVIVPVA
jgi:hypothetical protein